jgi:hypothetical protein
LDHGGTTQRDDGCDRQVFVRRCSSVENDSSRERNSYGVKAAARPAALQKNIRHLRSFGDLVWLGGLVLEEAEGGVALAEDAGLQEAADALRQIESAAVLDDDEAALAEKRGGAQETEDTVVLIFFGVGRVDEDEIEWGIGGLVAGGDFFESAEGVEGKDMDSAGNR